MKTTFIKTLRRPIGKGEVWYCRSNSTDVVRERLCLFSGEEGLPPPLSPPFLLLLWVCGAGQPRERFVSLTPALTWHLGHPEHMLPVTGAQGSSFPHVLPRSPDWCAQQKGLVLEVSSCAYDRLYFYAWKQNQDIWWTALSFQTAWSYNCKVRSFMLRLQNCEWNLNISFKQLLFFFFFLVWNFAWSIYICIITFHYRVSCCKFS